MSTNVPPHEDSHLSNHGVVLYLANLGYIGSWHLRVEALEGEVNSGVQRSLVDASSGAISPQRLEGGFPC